MQTGNTPHWLTISTLITGSTNAKTILEGYHSILLDEESQPLRIFITEWGRFVSQDAQGYLDSGDAYTCRYNEIVKDIPCKVNVVDDTLLFDKNIEDAFYQYSGILVTM